LHVDTESVIFTNTAPGKNLTLWEAPFSLERGQFQAPPEPLTFGRGMDTDAQVSPDGTAVTRTVRP
jgi:hypothetical protein